jgi:hypothetical protein
MSSDEPLERLAGFVNRPLPDVRKASLHHARRDARAPAWTRALRPLLPVDPRTLEDRLRELTS